MTPHDLPPPPASGVPLARARDLRLRPDLPRLAESLDSLPTLLRELGARRVLLVVDQGALAATAAAPLLHDLIGGLLVARFTDFTPNPTSEQVAAAARLAIQHRADCLVAFGGGSCLDVAKIAALAAAAPPSLDAIARAQAPAILPALPVIAIPTTSGTGSEATHFAAIYVDGVKASVAHHSARPRAVILDPTLHMAMPSRLAGVTGLDALAQAMESMWSVGATDESLAFASIAGTLMGRSLIASARDRDPSARTHAMWGAHLAGCAINISKTTAAHALSYAITTRFNTPHGLGVALTLGHLAAENALVTEADCADPRGPAHVRQRVHDAAACLGTAPAELPGAIRDLLTTLDLPASLSQAGVDRASLDFLARSVDPVRLANNPRGLTITQLESLLTRAF